MGFLDIARSFLSLEPMRDLQTRDIDIATPFDYYPPLSVQLANIRAYNRFAPSVQQAMGVPAIFGAVNLLANLTGSMSMTAMRNEVELPPRDRPPLIVRPDPLTIPREFWRATAYNIASRGEAWWWVAKRDSDGNAIALWNCNPAEVTVEENPLDPRFPIITWRGQRKANDDMRQLVYSREPGSLRGVGPLQMCGAAISVAVESQIWAANFFLGGNSAIWVKTGIPLSGGDGDETEGTPAEISRFLDDWMSKDSNTPRITDDSVEDIKSIDINPQGAQMLEARAYQNVEVATMFNMDAQILNAIVSGSSLTYQNIGQRFDMLIRQCLRPNYLEVIEQTMSDLLTRSTVSRFNTDFLTMADPMTRWQIYNLAVPVIGQDEAAAIARQGEGLAPGDVENAPVPFAPPAAIPTAASLQMRSLEVRCPNMRTKRRSGITRLEKCDRLVSREGKDGWCPHCKVTVAA